MGPLACQFLERNVHAREYPWINSKFTKTSSCYAAKTCACNEGS